MSGIECECPHCHADLRGPEIKPDSLHFYGYEPGATECRYGCGNPPHFSRLVGDYSWELDRTIAWVCPDCKERWAR